MRHITVSIVINTLNRGSSLQKTLESFRWLKYQGAFEVVVINGPSTDNSDEVLASWLPDIRIGKCDVPNISVSRNIGICMARGDIVAFTDDDAIPEPEWLSRLAEAYIDPMVGAAGGLVYDHTGYNYQYKYCLTDRFGNADLSPSRPTPHLSFPQSYRFPHLMGCNASFRRSALLEIGGFDEEYEYYLDETDVCLRIVDAGYIIAQLPHAYVHHTFSPNSIRSENRVARHRYPIIKNKIYFMLKHGREHYSDDRILHEQHEFIQKQRTEVSWAEDENLLSASEASAFSHDLERAVDVGTKRGLEGVADGALIDRNKLEKYSGEFLQFRPIENETFKSIVFVSRDIPDHDGNSAALFIMELAEALAAQGDLVHVITQSVDINRVEFKNGVWLHRMQLRNFEQTPDAASRNIPQDLWNWSSTALAETKRIAGHRAIDAVEASLWNCEGAAFLFDGKWPLVTNMQTPLRLWLNAHPEKRQDQEWMKSVGTPLMEMEKELMMRSDAVRFSCSAARDDIEGAYRLSFEERILVSPHGSPCERPVMPASSSSPAHGSKGVKRTAFILMTHRFDRSILDEFQRILEGISGTDQAFILSDGSESPPASVIPWLHTYDITEISRRAVRTIGNGVHHNIHLPWIDLFVSHPGFDYYWIIEYDVKYAGPWSDFFDSFRDLPHDLLCTHLRPYSHEPDWAWWNEVQPPDSNLPEEHILRGFMPITRLSREGLEKLRDAVDEGLCGFYEGMLPTLFLNSGLRIADIGGNGPFVPPGFRNRFYTSVSDPVGSLWGLGTFRFRPPIRFPRIMPGRLYHPVKPELVTHDAIDGCSASAGSALETALEAIRQQLSEVAAPASGMDGQVEQLLQEFTGLSSIELGEILDRMESAETGKAIIESLRQQFHELITSGDYWLTNGHL